MIKYTKVTAIDGQELFVRYYINDSYVHVLDESGKYDQIYLDSMELVRSKISDIENIDPNSQLPWLHYTCKGVVYYQPHLNHHQILYQKTFSGILFDEFNFIIAERQRFHFGFAIVDLTAVEYDIVRLVAESSRYIDVHGINVIFSPCNLEFISLRTGHSPEETLKGLHNLSGIVLQEVYEDNELFYRTPLDIRPLFGIQTENYLEVTIDDK